MTFDLSPLGAGDWLECPLWDDLRSLVEPPMAVAMGQVQGVMMERGLELLGERRGQGSHSWIPKVREVKGV